MSLDQPTKVWQVDMAAVSPCREGPAREAMERVLRFLFTRTFKPGFSPQRHRERHKMAGSSMGMAHFLRNYSSIRKNLGQVNIFPGLGQSLFKTSCNSEHTEMVVSGHRL